MSREIKFRAWYKGEMTTKSFSDLIVDNHLYWYFTDGVLMQYTGLKDKNGVEIYEGDIVRQTQMVKSRNTGKLVNNGTSRTRVIPPPYADFRIKNPEQYKVIGNIYETPDLTNQKDEG